ncbi:Os11g0475700 [Oryza sativa Japonica Group]|uniref:Os11g0475700 protein n=2 Tax=Oryza sativa subsp. japonica TaxID=39947 RepID=Q2R4F7_ORYSJ|nr:hypothetical protein LOC_Os11g28640 [Oryza sativa Japonica Group]EAZ18345.1 hypothetical protein OsJ_33874 [Oryza sativa Japonica Group]BAT14016.1 Os11g0475700 [Oryza sativa Japonica Group]
MDPHTVWSLVVNPAILRSWATDPTIPQSLAMNLDASDRSACPTAVDGASVRLAVANDESAHPIIVVDRNRVPQGWQRWIRPPRSCARAKVGTSLPCSCDGVVDAATALATSRASAFAGTRCGGDEVE